MDLKPDICYRALKARDPRFDGTFFVGVKTTGIYCRPVCPARTPGRDRCLFFRHAVQAEAEGFRACFRCRPELAPGDRPMDTSARLVRGAMALIDEGFLNENSVDALAERLGVTSRHLRRTLTREVGVAPAALAQSRRLGLAKRLVQDTPLPLVDVAFASGFSSVRRFNAVFKSRLGRSPSDLRRKLAPEPTDEVVGLRLDYRPPLDWAAALDFLRHRATAGTESVEGLLYRRTVRLGEKVGWLSISPHKTQRVLQVHMSLSLTGATMPILAGLRRQFDLDAHPQTIAEHLGADPLLAPLLARHPGLRVPGAFDRFETSIRAILGQQISVSAATALCGRLAARFGEAIETPHPSLDRLFPTPEVLAKAETSDIASLGMPSSRARTIAAFAEAVSAGSVCLSDAPEPVAEALLDLPGIGPWTARTITMRALGAPDAFPATDLGVLRAFAALGGPQAQISEHSERWRPWRAYAALHLWTSESDTRE